MERRLRWIIALACIGIPISGYSLWHHFDESQGWCSLGDTLNCDVVNRGPYSEIAGIPVALIGLVGYAGIAVVAWLAMKKEAERRELITLLRVAVAVALLFSLYLTYLEAVVLRVFCPLCLGSFVIVVTLTVLALAPDNYSRK